MGPPSWPPSAAGAIPAITAAHAPHWRPNPLNVSLPCLPCSPPAQGRGLLGRTVPGVLKGSMVAALPDVGAAMDAPVSYRVRFEASSQEGGVVADR
jgi:hypothetical protein